MKEFEFVSNNEAIELAFEKVLSNTPELCNIITKISISILPTDNHNVKVYNLNLYQNEDLSVKYEFVLSSYKDCCGIKIVSDMSKSTIYTRNKKHPAVKYIPLIAILLLCMVEKKGVITFAFHSNQLKIKYIVDHINDVFFDNRVKPVIFFNPNSYNTVYTYTIPLRPMMLAHLEKSEQIFKPNVVKQFQSIDDNNMSKQFAVVNTLDSGSWSKYKNEDALKHAYERRIIGNQKCVEYYCNLITSYLKFLI